MSKRDGFYRSDRHELLELVQPSAPLPWIEPSRQNSTFMACASGPCQGGKKLCPSPEACRVAESAQRRADGSLRQLVWAVLLVAGVAVLTTIVWHVWLVLR